ncbi:aldehyde dehydrogenase family protein [Pseudonocardia endophytica]|uniref:Aldehyde dehydrogenase n=1 Tax=Pseudonocardia endophytica TaxID=401976 RepID=A0A4R1HM81_PSEEN|nr:aldehyde dehydrogenase family protein [Pseudonocardia endophytica]TCK20759.1 acyl-CoA reductase-like NAD-dependent aldehyde dehydrogenase [Pseudonocardia endophytica]
MSASADTTTRPSDDADSFASLDPRTGAEVGRYPIHDRAHVRAAVDAAAEAATWWEGLGFAGRRKRLANWRRTLVAQIDGLARTVREETGKPFDDARLELVLAIDHLDWASANAEKVLKKRSVSPGLLMANQAASLAYRPFGVIGVIGPWNYPVFTPMGSIAYALAAGNAVVFKPSELTPGVGHALARTFAEAVPDAAQHPVFTVVTGKGETGAELCRAPGVGKIAFTGSSATGRRVMATASENLVPVLIECGGKDPLIVAADADVEAAADAAVWGGMSNAGQTCVGVERVYAVESVADRFLAAVTAKARSLRVTATDGPDGDFGPMTMPAQLEIVRRHVTDALERGGRAVVGGADSVGERSVAPVVIADVPEESSAVTEETFGPLLVVNRVPDVDEAVRRANATGYGLGATVFSEKRGDDIAARLRCGMVSVNGVISFAGIPSLPFGGVGESGFGRIHGEDGLREFTRPQAVARQRFALPIAVTSFKRTARGMSTLIGLVKARHGR